MSNLLVVPLFKDGAVTGIIVCGKQNGKYGYKLIKRGYLLKFGFSPSLFENAKTYAGLFKHFDSKFKVRDFDFFSTITFDPTAQQILREEYRRARNEHWVDYEITNCSVSCVSTDAGQSWDCHEHDCYTSYGSYWVPEAATLEGPEGSGGGGDGDGNEVPDGIDDDGIDCASFNFANVNSNWQEAGLNNVHFFVRYFDGHRLFSRQMIIDRTLYFGFPIEAGGIQVSKGMAAQTAASAIQFASDRVHSMFIETPAALSSTVVAAFLAELKSYMNSSGGRVDFNGSGSPAVIPTNAYYILVGNGDCL